MAEPIGPGDMVECINNLARAGRHFAPQDRLTLGALYTVVRVGTGIYGDPIVELAEKKRVTAVRGQWGYAAFRFRPISRRADFETFLAEIKTPVPMPEHETA